MARRKGNKGNRAPRPRMTGAGGTIWLYGVHAVTAALANPARTRHRLVATEDGAERLAATGERPEIVERRALEELLPSGAVHQGLALQTTALPPPAIEDIADQGRAAARAAVIVLDQVSDPRNVGAVVRSAAVFGALGVVIPDRHSPPSGAVLAKSASGGLESVPLVRVTNLARALVTLKESGFWCVGLDSAAGTMLDRAALPDHTAFVLGAEGAGLRRLTREKCDFICAIPGVGAVASLNVSCAATIALYAFAQPA
jgi:23S rRNA (guanosine2251-2'-O)-methyltransferase